MLARSIRRAHPLASNLEGAGGGLDVASAARLFDILSTPRRGVLARQLEGLVEVVARPGETPRGALRNGDLVIRRALGEGGLAHVALLGATESLLVLDCAGRLPLDRLVVRPRRLEAPFAPVETDPEVPDSAVADRFVAAHATRFCTPGQAGSASCAALASPRPIGRVVIHALAVPNSARRTAVEAIVSGWQRAGRQAASHYIVGRGGEVVQMVREADVAFHTPGHNVDSIGIEHADVCNDPAPFTDRLYERSAVLVRDLSRRHGFPVTSATVAGHDTVAGNHGDPGPYWDWEYYFRWLAWDGRAESRPLRLVASVADAPAPEGWTRVARRAIADDHCANRRDPWNHHYWIGRGGAPAEVAVPVAVPAVYVPSLWWPRVEGASRTTTVAIEVACPSAPCAEPADPVAIVDQRYGFGQWNALEPLKIRSAPALVRVHFSTAGPGLAVADAVRLLRRAPLPQGS